MGCYAAIELVGRDLQGNVVLLRPHEPQPEWAKSSRLGDSLANWHGWKSPCNDRGMARPKGYKSLLGSLLACMQTCHSKD